VISPPCRNPCLPEDGELPCLGCSLAYGLPDPELETSAPPPDEPAVASAEAA